MSPPAETPRSPAPAIAHAVRRPVVLIASVALLLSAGGFGWTLRGHFLGDDFGYVGRFYEFPFAQWPRLFAESWAGNMWGFQLRELRPLTALSFMLDARIWEGNAFGFRLTNLLLHAACSTMVGVLAWRVAGRALACGATAAALFALHPAHAEPVQWITGRVDVLATTFYLAGFLVFVRHRETPSRAAPFLLALCYALSAFSKEFGLMLPVMCAVADLTWLRGSARWREARTWTPYAACLVVFVAYLFCRRAAFGAGGMGAALPAWNSLAFHTQLAERQLTYLCYLFMPAQTWPQQGASLAVAHALRVFLLIAGGVLAAFAAWRWAVRWRPIAERRGVVFFGLGWYLVTTLPLIVTYISARHLYVATAGLCVAAAVAVHALLRPKLLQALAVAGICALFAHRLSAAMKPWHAAAMISGQIARELEALEPVAKPGGALFLDVPEIRDGAYVWTWAVPFALRPPFTRDRLDERLVVLESRGLYVDWERWHEQPAVAALRRVEAESWIVQLFEGRPARRIAVPPDRVRAAADHFPPERAKQQPHETWRALINAMAPPDARP